MDFRVQIVSLVVVIAVIFNYLRNRRLEIMSTKLFSGFLFLAFINLIFDIVTVYTIYHLDIIPSQINRLCHQIFIGSLNFLIFCLYFYVEIKSNTQKRYSIKKLLLRVIPLLLAIGMVLFGNLYYYIGEEGRYSFGPMANTVYLSAVIYILLIVYTLIKDKGNFSNESKTSILLGILIWCSIAVFQFFYPTTLVSSVAISIMVLFIYLSFENPREYLDLDTNTLNRRAFNLMLAENIESKNPFYMIHFILTDSSLIRNSFGYSQLFAIMETIANKIKEVTDVSVYHSRSNMISFMIFGDKNCKKLMGELEKCDFSYLNQKGLRFDFKYYFSVCKCPQYAKDIEEHMQIIDYLKRNHLPQDVSKKIIMIDEEEIRKKNYKAKVESLVQNALKEDGFEVYYQPIYSTAEKKFVSAEALVRLKDKESLGYISPEVFIPIAEENGMICELGNIIFENVCKFIKKSELWQYGVKYIEVNLSVVQAMDSGLPECLADYMRKYDIKPEFINLEITETATVGSEDMLSKNIRALKEIGCSFSMDDFGTGYSNLSKIAEIHFDLIKLDKSLIWPCFLDNGEESRVILNYCIEMILKLGMHIVAEGIETKEQAKYLIEKGVNYLQGYYFSKPISEQDYIDYLKENMSREVDL